MEIQIKRFSFRSKFDDVPIYGVCMIPKNPIGILQMVHGMCEHKGRFLSFMQRMAAKGYITVMHDGRGHGESIKTQEDIGYCYESLETGYVGDIYKITQQMKKEYPGLPVILYGHSMGSLATRVYLRNHDDAIDGLIISGCPSYNDFVPMGLWLVKMMAKWKGERYRSIFVQKLVSGSFESRFWKEGRKYAWLAVKKSVGEEFQEDPLCMFTYTLNGFETLLNLEYITYRAIGFKMENRDMPILFISGSEDPCYINEKRWRQAIQRMTELGYNHIEEKRYAGMRHEIHNEEDNELVFRDIDEFCRRVISACKM